MRFIVSLGPIPQPSIRPSRICRFFLKNLGPKLIQKTHCYVEGDNRRLKDLKKDKELNHEFLGRINGRTDEIGTS